MGEWNNEKRNSICTNSTGQTGNWLVGDHTSLIPHSSYQPPSLTLPLLLSLLISLLLLFDLSLPLPLGAVHCGCHRTRVHLAVAALIYVHFTLCHAPLPLPRTHCLAIIPDTCAHKLILYEHFAVNNTLTLLPFPCPLLALHRDGVSLMNR